MLLRHAVDEAAVIEGQVGRVEFAIQAEVDRALVEIAAVAGDDAGEERQRKLVVAGGHRRVGREHAQGLDLRHHRGPPVPI